MGEKMKKNIVLSAIAVSLLASASLNAAEDLSSMFTEGKISGQVRMFYIDRQYQGSSGKDTHRNSTAIGGHLKFETADYKGLSLGTAFYTTNSLSIFNYDNVDPSLLGEGGDNYSILGEAYINYDMSSLGTKTTAKLGFQRYDTPMMGSDDARMIPNTFEAYKFVNKDLDSVSFQVAQVTSIAYGTFSSIYNNSGILGATSGYSGQGKDLSNPAIATGNNPQTGKYYNLGSATVGKSTAGITNAMLAYKGKTFNAKLSNDYAWDLYNTLYLEAGAKWDCLLNSNVHPFIAAQVIKQNSVGGEYMKHADAGVAGAGNTHNGEIDSLYWAVKVGAKYAGLSGYIAYSETGANDENDAAYKNAVVSQFGGMPAFTQGMVTRHMFLAGTKAKKAVIAYNFKELGADVSAATYYASFDMDANSGYGDERTASEAGFDIKYNPASVDNLNLRFRGNFPRKFAGNDTSGYTGWNEYRLIANYNF